MTFASGTVTGRDLKKPSPKGRNVSASLSMGCFRYFQSIPPLSLIACALLVSTNPYPTCIVPLSPENATAIVLFKIETAGIPPLGTNFVI